MSKKLKGVALDSSPYDAKARFKHQTLLLDFQDLQKETISMRNRLEAAKQRKLTLLAEVRFLRKRHKYLSTMNSAKFAQVRELVPPVSLGTQSKYSAKDKVTNKKDASRHRLPPLPSSNQKTRVYTRKDASRGNTIATLDLDHKQKLHSGKEAKLHNISPLSDFSHRGRIYSEKEAVFLNMPPVIDLNQSERIYSGNDAAVRNPTPALDLNQDSSLVGKEASLPSRAPIFDLNEISTEEEDVQSNPAPLKLEELKRSLMRGGNEEQHNDLKLSVCRNSGEGPSRVGKRKISWQDPVALRV